MTAEFEIQDCKVRDLATIQKIENSSFDDPYSPSIFWNLFLSPRSDFRIAKIGVEIVGYCVVRFEGSEAHIISLAVEPIARRKGVGSKLLEDAILRARKIRDVEGMELEVRTDNEAAILLYFKFGFSRAGVLQDYYGRRKDALQMRLSFQTLG